MKFTLNGIEITCTPQEFNELRGLGTITAERPSVSTLSVADACKAAGIPLKEKWPPEDAPKLEDVAAQRLINSPKFQWSLDDIGRLCKSELPKSPDGDDAIALAKDYKPIKDGYVFMYVVADRDKSRVCEYYLKSTLDNTYTPELQYALQYTNPDMAFGFVASHPDKNLCVVRVKVPVSE